MFDYFVFLLQGVAYQCYHGFLRAVQEGNIQWESRTYPYPGTPITQRFSHSQYMLLCNVSCQKRPAYHVYIFLMNLLILRNQVTHLASQS